MDGLAEPLTLTKRVQNRKAALFNERSSWMSTWEDISRFQQPRLGRYFLTDRNDGKRRDNNIVDNTAIFGARTLAAGLMAGVTSPARPWFRVAIRSKDLMERPAVKAWCHDVSTILLAVFSSSNTYRALHSIYEELGLFGTGCSIVDANFNNVIHHHALTIGEYALATDDLGVVNTMTREYQMTVEQMVSAFGLEAVSRTVRELYDRGRYEQWVTVIHEIGPRRKRDQKAKTARNMPFASIYVEPGREDVDNAVLRESGRRHFPVLAPRWLVTGQDVYGNAPGMECQGDVKQLQHQQRRKGTAIDYQVEPPLQVPTGYKEAKKARLPGGVFHVDQMSPTGGVRSAFEVKLDLQALLLDIQDVRERIRQAYYVDLFLMLANDTRSGITATEVAERHEEKLLMLGPVLERLHNELLQPLIDIAFDFAIEAGIMPRPPDEIMGADLEIEFVSVLSQAQRIVATQGMDRLLGVVGNMAQFEPAVLRKIDWLQAVDEYGDAYGVPPKLIISDDAVRKRIAEDARAAQAQQMAAAAEPAAKVAQAAKTASEIDPDAMRQVMTGLMGYSSPSPQET